MKKRIPFGVWEPDSNAVGGFGRLSAAVNVVPMKGGYKAIHGVSAVEIGIVELTAFPMSAANVVAAYSAVDNSSGLADRVDYIASTTDVYSVESNASTVYVVTGSCATSLVRDFAQYGGEIYVANGTNSGATAPICSININSGSSFTAVPSGFQAKCVGILRDFVVFGSTRDDTDGARQTRVRWSAFGNGQDYIPSAATQSDYQDLTDNVGEVKKILGGNEAFVVCENAVVLMSYVGGATIMRFDYIHDVGTNYGNSCVRVGDYVYFWSKRGFVRAGKALGDVAYIGHGRVDEEYQSLLYTAVDANTNFQARGYHDEENKCIGWQFEQGSGRALAYCYAADQWVVHGDATDRAGAAVVYASGLAYYEGAFSSLVLDRPSVVAWVGTDNKLRANLDRANKAKIQLATGYEELSPGRKSVVDKVWPVQDVRGGSQTNPELVITSIPKLNGVNLYAEPTSTYSSTASLQSDGFFTVTGPGSYEGKFHRFQLENSDTASERAGEQAILGIDVEYFERGDY